MMQLPGAGLVVVPAGAVVVVGAVLVVVPAGAVVVVPPPQPCKAMVVTTARTAVAATQRTFMLVCLLITGSVLKSL